jgi:hypothetical protein
MLTKRWVEYKGETACSYEIETLLSLLNPVRWAASGRAG